MRARAFISRRCGYAGFFALAALLLGGCWNGRILFSYEPPFWSALGDPGRLRASMTYASLLRGYLPRFDISASVDPAASLTGSLSSSSWPVAVVGPLLSLQWADFVTRFPRTRFVLIDVPPPSGPLPGNAVFLTFDRTAAFHEAGRAAGQAVRAASGLVGILSCEGSGLSPQEADAFSRGVSEVLEGDRPQEQTLGASPDPRDIRAAVQQMGNRGVGVFLLGLGEWDPDGLDAVRDAGALAVVSDWQSSRASSASVLASIEEAVPSGIFRALDALRTGTSHVQGAVRLVWRRKI